MSRMRRRMVQAYERAAAPATDHWLQRQFPHLKVERRAVAAAALWALVAALPAWRANFDANGDADLGPRPRAALAPASDIVADIEPQQNIAPAGQLKPIDENGSAGPANPAGPAGLPAENEAAAVPRPTEGPVWGRYLGQAALFALLAQAFLLALSRARLPVVRRSRAVWGVGAVALATVWAGYALPWLGLGGEWAPLGLAVGLVALGMSGLPLAVWTSTLVSLAALVAMGAGMNQAAATLPAAWVLATLARGVRRRSLLAAAALAAALTGLFVEGMWILSAGGDPLKALGFDESVWPSAATFILSGICGGIGLALLVRPMENWFGVTTRMRLQSLLDLEHPLMRRLVAEAPGTYNHSVLVGALAEAGAEAAGADGLLAKAGGYFHDIGKLFKPGYFTENEQGVSRHDRLSPYLSSLIIVAHVKDGGELAEACGLPPAVTHIVRSHHGTGKTVYFLHRARQRARPGETVQESQFSYPGPTPRTVEAAAVMLADSIEAAARSLGTAGGERLRKLVHQIVMDRLLGGQLSDAGMDLTQLANMEKAFYRVLLGMYHARVKYPGQEEERRRR